ncbi:uncharacterized protein M421DRAFT_335586 [Didymella exigua CBS 183.55]|uniref:Rhodopsin domain-containing protein n=1 Tax=Didymella exigua CBS 183.55 TaxID=1150837 RepID=A0A6A5RAZ4_9PLEO|nr:uncharacterized protein M421DRAFT_335586 [Didymella exigua CBS 183.55]KAF1922967.1 hypothetical protein M421DRAFT_335586 [Didymella exigua CBS 183.55]
MFIKTERIPMTSSASGSLTAVAALWVLFAITVVFRFVGRVRGIGLGLDDILSAVALILSSSTIGMNAVVFTIGVGWDFDPSSAVYLRLVNNLPVIMQITFAFTLIYIWCLAALKLSQLALYIRVFADQLRIWVYGVGAVVVIWALTFNFLFIFLCDPISQQWTIERVGHCMDQMLVLKCLIMTNLFTDLFIVVLPIRSVWQLQMRNTEKFAVLACFSLGGACVIISLARFIQIYTIDLIGNLTGTSLTTFMLCSIELMLAGLCINIPMLRPFYIRFRAKYKSSSVSSSGGLGSHKQPGSRQPGAPPLRPDNYTAWIELVSYFNISFDGEI